MRCLIYLLIVLSSSLQAASPNCKLSGKTIKIIDGDTIYILDKAKTTHKIRLAGIDTPERGQPFGKKAKVYLSHMVGAKWVCVDWRKQDRYKRKVGKVIINNTDINLQMIKQGLAWHYKKYQKEQTIEDAKKYAVAEVIARSKTLGLWSRPDYIEPWNWRKGSRPKRVTKREKRRIIEQKRKVTPSNNDSFNCAGKKFCGQMRSCAEARYYLTKCGLKRLDRDNDSIPCEAICGN